MGLPAEPLNQKLSVISSRLTRQAASAKDWLKSHLAKAGVQLNGSNPWDPNVHNNDFYLRVMREGSLGAGESYMDGWWDCERLDEMFKRLMSVQLDEVIQSRWILIRHWLMARLVNLQSTRRAYQVGEQHYDVGNDLYRAMLDKRMVYSCGYWQDAEDLDQAQESKLDLACKKMQLNAGEEVLDIGCGWGSFAEFSATQYGTRVTGVTISREQQKLARHRCRELPVDIRLQDYRMLSGRYDKLVSIGMFEHVGQKNYHTYFSNAHRLMQDEGIFLLHTIGKHTAQLGTDPWIHKYIFPNGAIPSLSQISQACEPFFVIEDVHNFGPDYDRTLMAWQQNVESAWPALRESYGERFRRMWDYYLKSCAGAFRSRQLQLFQLVLRKKVGPLPRYHSPR
ncbi:cyclopropane fatty acyl phospholipid synthase [Bowmanella dokdonensis]|uniref:Cyclopropane fatty acyl phospholipid synthase n=1 Tax=Bowmanella dokdonensis TaxID=751969 RepID=A0A939IMD4_9ALTE|nr:cyclopropane fatty acyl phospholipid synthase [Bowmanella dokdonensis]MBN7823680.1 cyclopropane fatty acyl phospholipid synthase [Bowmanella dokdonensis]